MLRRYHGPWTRSPTTFSNSFYIELLERTWTEKKWKGPSQFEDASGELMMLPSDYFLLKDESFLKHVKAFAKDEKAFFEAFAAAWTKLIELGCDGLQK